MSAKAVGKPLAVKYVQIVPSFQGGMKQIQAQIDPSVTQAAKSAGTKFSKGMAASLNLKVAGTKIQDFGAKISGVGGVLTSKFTKPVGLAAAGVATLVGALGFKRLVGIDTARAQFKGLGYDADEVMEQVDKGVTGTALSMADGASMAVGILATGAVPMEKLEEQIQRTANVSAAYGVDASHAGNLLNQVLTKNKVTYGDLSQMQQNGIPIISQLADHYGVAGDEIQKMAKDGEISIEDLNKVLDEHSGAAAEEYAKSWEGVSANIKSNLGRIGAQVLGPAFEKAQVKLADFLDWLKKPEIKEAAADFGAKIGEAFEKVGEWVKQAIDWWKQLSPGMKDLAVKAAVIAVAAGPVVTVIGKVVGVVGVLVKGIGGIVKVVQVATTVMRVLWAVMAANPVGVIIAAIAALVAGLVWFFTKTETGQKLWKKFTDALKNAWEAMGKALKNGWERVDKQVFVPIKKGAGWVADKFKAIKKTIVAQWDAMKSNLKKGWDWIKTKVFDPLKKGAQWVADKFKAIKAAIKKEWDTLKSNLKKGWDWINTKVFDPMKRGAGWVSDKFTAIKTTIKTQWDAMKNNLKKGWDWIKSKTFDPMKKGVEAVGAAFKEAKKVIKTQWDKVKEIAAKPINFVIEKVYTGGIKKLVESTAEKLGLSISLPTVHPIKLARGGRLPGFGGGDRIPTILEAGEFVINKFAAARHHGLLAAINSTGGGGGYGVVPGTVGALGGGGCGGGSCGIGLAKGGWLAGVGEWFKDKAAGIGEFLKDPLAAVAELITKPVTSMLGDLDKTVWADLGKGGVKTVLGAIPAWFKKKAESIIPPGTGGPGLVGAARKALGVPYVWGGSSIPPGLDCSGLVYWAAQQLGLSWPRLTAAGYQSGSRYKPLSSALPGDLLFWGNPAHHVAIYSGPGQMVHAPVPGDYVKNAAIYGNPSVGSYGGSAGVGGASTYTGLVSRTAATASSSDDFARRLRSAQYDSGGLLRPGYTLAYNGTGKNETIRTHEQEMALRGGAVVYNDNRRIYNPVAEPDSIRVAKNLQRAGAKVGALV